ncbi:MAG: aldo/keto reductase [Candidatus Rokubacteria bacterium]|nr:aldo/keto reductase [Candidatus Rokubacteria bacterium]
MDRRKLGKTDMTVSALGFGGSEIGYERASARTVATLLGGALDAGLNVIDTAECYEDSEVLIGKAVGTRRREFFLFTKCGHAGGWGRADWRLDPLLKSVERSLKRLGTDYVDLVQLHSCSLDVLKRGDAIVALERARARGVTRYIGYSGDGAAARYAIETGRFDALQTSVSIADQEALELTLPLARERGMGVIAKRPLANVAWRYTRRPDPYYADYYERLRALDYPFLRGAWRSSAVGPPSSKAATAAATALRFTLSVPGVHTAIVGTAKPERWQENAAIVKKGTLPKNEFDAIRTRWAQVATASWEGQV